MANEGFKLTFLDDDGKAIVDEKEIAEENEITEEVDDSPEEEIEQSEPEDENNEESTDEVGEEEVEEEDFQYSSNEEVEEEEDVVSYDELPEAVQKYIDFLEETGGSIEDFVSINRDITKLPQDEVIRQYIKENNPYYDEADVDYEMEKLFSSDEMDSDREIRDKQIAKKKMYGEAVKSLQAKQEKYKADLGSSKGLTPEAKEALEYRQQLESQQEATRKKVEQSRNSFIKQTDKLFGKDFKGFEVKVGNESYTYKPENVSKVKEQNLNVDLLLNKYLDKEGNVVDVAGYHKMMTVASDPEGLAQHFFELGRAAMAEEDAKESKNVSMKPRQGQPSTKTNQPKFKFLDDGSANKGMIKLKNY